MRELRPLFGEASARPQAVRNVGRVVRLETFTREQSNGPYPEMSCAETAVKSEDGKELMVSRRLLDGWDLFVVVGASAALIWYIATSFVSGAFAPALLAALVTAVALVLRSAKPMLAIAISIVGALLAGILDTSALQLWIAAQFILLSVALAVGRRRSIGPAAATASALFACVTLMLGEAPLGGAALGVISWTLGVWGLAAAISSERREAHQWQDQARHLQRTREEEIRRHIVEERLRIARDLHDELGHEIAVIGVNAGAADASLIRDPDNARDALRTIRASTRRVLAELQQILGVLRDDQDGMSRPGSISDVLDTARRSGLTVESGGIDTTGLTPNGAAAVYRAVQEATTNAGKHGTGCVTLETSREEEAWKVTIVNPVEKDTVPGTGFGLIGMRERIEQAGGKLRAAATDDTFSLFIELPWEADGYDQRTTGR